ncbi:RagB/SusD family nutrient uptake outer membrane protein [Sphingobacterium sp. UT-1RO-CII-1]|uniref:RagB/SusD family nutrient uptake outer membrane protein n=1 Tax=Sphingobacterium sp. UT-1RO-CII-1 TaxID=2995225 RepID=UPI00227C3E5E|nr:RagB/SusD family nutrient uptake outer membrane protein [Sphingobacterium sp. UT-1RO-CII-1]MCY4780033.1 RagB/SusD family nutrient uptake outer membrane protein [Sphingobacterium sp. UT-1RO-CII-1]
MKKLNIYILTLGCLLLISSCKDVLNVQPYDRISEDIIWSTKANAETFIFGSYGIMERYNTGPGQDVYTSNIQANDGTARSAFNVFREIVDNTYDAGFNNWAQVRRSNMIIQKVTESVGISEEDKKPLIAEGKFLRAMSYYDVARKIGRIVWIDKVLKEDDELLLPTTANPYESYGYIIKDLEDAVADLPTTKIAGRANKYVAAAFLTEVCLQALAYKNYPNAANVDPNDPLLDKVITNANLVIKEGGYEIETDYEGMFNQTKSTSPEIIFAVYKKAINTVIQNTPMQLSMPNISVDKINKFEGSPLFNKPVPFECWPEHFPSQNLADAYLTIDKAQPNKALQWNQTSQYKAAVDEGVSVMIPHSRLGFPHDKVPKAADESVVVQGKIKAGSQETLWTLTNENRDARWKASILSDSSIFYEQTMTMTMRGNAGRWISINGGDWGATATNMYWRKGMYSNVSPSFLNTVTTDYHYVSMRLGRVYLNLAEAYLLKNDLTNARINFNKTRVEHGQLPASLAGDLSAAWKDYKTERRVELVGENDYYYSLLRWGRYGNDANNGLPSGGTIVELTEPMRVLDISKDRKSFAIVTGPFNNAYNQRVFKPERRYLFPIPQSFIDNNANFAPQNPNW